MNVRHKPYEIKETPEFLRQVSRLCGSVGKWDEIKTYLDLYLARNPSVGHSIENTNCYGISMSTKLPMTLYYSVDDSRQVITYLEIHRV